MNASRRIITTIASKRPSTGLHFRRPLAIAVPIPAGHQPIHPPPPPARKLQEDETLFKYTSGRWLYNEEEQMAQRYIKFDVAALHQVIHNACGSTVVGMEKKEGMFNKSFIVTLANGKKVAARIKNPIAGPEHLMTACEVATMDYVRNHLGMPVPNVITWSSRAAENNVGAEYIIMDMAEGVPLSNVWAKLDPRRRKNIVNSLVNIESGLLKAKFSHYGGLYYKSDIPADRQAPTLFAGGYRNAAAEAKFCIGPSPDRAFYEDERAQLDINRGPWSSPQEYLASLAEREEAWLSAHAKPHMHDDPFRSVVGPQSVAEHLDTLKQFRSVIPAIVPTSSKVLSSTIWHPDLNAGNIFVSTDDHPRVTGIIDWQGTWAGPAYLQINTPTFLDSGVEVASGLAMPQLPENFADMSVRSQSLVYGQHKAQMLQKLYEIKQVHPFRVTHRDVRTLPAKTAGRTWKDGILPLRLALLSVAARWRELSTPDQLCPIRFTREEFQRLKDQRDRYVNWHDLFDDLNNMFGMRSYGWVTAGEYDNKRSLLDRTRKSLSPELQEEMEKLMPQQWWPYRDTLTPLSHSSSVSTKSFSAPSSLSSSTISSAAIVAAPPAI